jgi:hypothetical protein
MGRSELERPAHWIRVQKREKEEPSISVLEVANWKVQPAGTAAPSSRKFLSQEMSEHDPKFLLHSVIHEPRLESCKFSLKP